MMGRGILLSLCVCSFVACSKRAENKNKGEYAPAVLSDDAVPVITVKATRPNGGAVEGKGPVLDPEVAEQRRNQNIAQPIEFGRSVAGITMSTRRSDAYNTMVFVQDLGGVEQFAEHVVIVWNDGADPVPFLIGIQDGYGGSLKLPDPYGKVTIGQRMDSVFLSVDDIKTFMKVFGASLESQPSTYDCEKALTCQYRESDDAFILDFRRGGLRFAKAIGLPLTFAYFSQPQVFYARATDPIVYGISIAGIGFSTKRTTVEARLGPPTASNDAGYLFYDQESVGVLWGGNNTPLSIQAIGTYQGTLNFGAVIGNRKINDSFATYAATNDELIKIIYRGLNPAVDASYNCLTQTVPTCALTVDTVNGFIFMQFGKNSLLFTNNAAKTWIQYLVNSP